MKKLEFIIKPAHQPHKTLLETYVKDDAVAYVAKHEDPYSLDVAAFAFNEDSGKGDLSFSVTGDDFLSDRDRLDYILDEV